MVSDPQGANAPSPSDLEFLELLNGVGAVIDKTISALEAKKFRTDPIAGRKYSEITSIIS